MSHEKDYFIFENRLTAFTPCAFLEGIVESIRQGKEFNADSAICIGSTFEVMFKQPEVETVEEEAVVETEEESGEEEAEQEETEESPSLTLEQIEAAQDSLNDLLELGKPFGITARSKKQMVELLKEQLDS